MVSFRNKGLGTKLLAHIINELKELNCEMIIVWPSENSVNWYLENNFKKDDEILVLEL